MIISATPFRISFAGGGSDIEFFYKKNKGAVLAATISKYIYTSIHPYFNTSQTLLKYSSNELVDNTEKIEHPIFREVIKQFCPEGGIEVTTTADIPSGTGLGSSSSFTVSLLHCMYAYKRTFCSKEKLAQKACYFEIEKLGEPIGKQDQYQAAYGGINFIEFNTDGNVVVSPVMLEAETIKALQENLLLFYTGQNHQASDILSDQRKQVLTSQEKTRNMVKMVNLAYQMRGHLADGDLRAFAGDLHRGWMLKKTLSEKITNPAIEKYYSRALEYGALGGKLLGAGGGGFLLLYCEKQNQQQLINALFDLNRLEFDFDWAGSRIIYVGEKFTKTGFLN